MLLPSKAFATNRSLIKAIPPKGDIDIYTDGSKKGGNIGMGIQIYDQGSRVAQCKGRLEPYNSVFQAEVDAFKAACEYIIRNNKSHKINFYSDSFSAIQALNAKKATSRLVAECFYILNYVAKFNTVQLQWVKAHCNIPGNEMADILAASPRTMDCATLKSFEYLMAREVTTADACSLADARNEISSTGGSYQDMLRALLMTEKFRNIKTEAN